MTALAAAALISRSLLCLNTTAAPLLPVAALASNSAFSGLTHSASRSYHQQAAYNGRPEYHATTILCVRKGGQVALIGDGQVSVGNTVVKPNAKKIRRIGGSVVAGFAGSAADGLTLIDRLETKLEEHPGQLMRAAVELAKQWRQDKALRFLQAELLVADATTTLTVSGTGDVLEPHDGVMAIGSGGMFAMAAARALLEMPDLDALTIGQRAMKIAADMCVFTNNNFMWEVMETSEAAEKPAAASS